MIRKKTWQEMGEQRRQQLRDGTWVNPCDLILVAQGIDRTAFRYPLTKAMNVRRAQAYVEARRSLRKIDDTRWAEPEYPDMLAPGLEGVL